MVNTYHVYVRIVHTKSPHVHLHLSCHPRQFSSSICNWCTFRGEKDNDKRHSIPPYDVIVDKTTLAHIIVHTTIYLLTRIILQRHKSFLLPSNFSPWVVQRLRHPPILILLYAASDNSNVAASDNHPSVPASASPTTVANDTQAAAPAAMVGNAWWWRGCWVGCRWRGTGGWFGWWLNDVRQTAVVVAKQCLHRGFLRYNLDEPITWGGHEYDHHDLVGIDQQNDVISLTVN